MDRNEWLNRREHGDGVVELQLGHAPENQLTEPFLLDFAREMHRLGEESQVRSILLTSPFKDFSTGVDPDLTPVERPDAALSAAFLALYSCPKPVVCATAGQSSGAGMFFTLASDIRVAHARASFEMIEVQTGTGYPVALLEIAREVLDTNTQRRMMLTGQRLGPIAARNAQIIEIIADDLDDLHGYALKEARKLASLPADTFSDIKMSLRRDALARIEARLDETLQEQPGESDPARIAS